MLLVPYMVCVPIQFDNGLCCVKDDQENVNVIMLFTHSIVIVLFKGNKTMKTKLLVNEWTNVCERYIVGMNESTPHANH